MKLKSIFAVFLCPLISYTAIGQESIEKLVILGSGPAGLTSAIYAGQSNLSLSVSVVN